MTTIPRSNEDFDYGPYFISGDSCVFDFDGERAYTQAFWETDENTEPTEENLPDYLKLDTKPGTWTILTEYGGGGRKTYYLRAELDLTQQQIDSIRHNESIHAEIEQVEAEYMAKQYELIRKRDAAIKELQAKLI